MGETVHVLKGPVRLHYFCDVFRISSLGGNSGNLSADLVASVFLIGLLVMAFLDRGE